MSVFAEVLAGAKRLALPLMSSSDWRICTYMRIEQYNNHYIFAPRAWVSAGQNHIIPLALIQHLGSQAGCSANFDFDILQLASKSSIISSFGRIVRRYFATSHGNCFVSESNVRFASRCNVGLNDAGLMTALNMSSRGYFNALKNYGSSHFSALNLFSLR